MNPTEMIASIRIIDAAANAREMYGADANYIAGRELPEHEYRFEVLGADGSLTTMHVGATADQIIDMIGARR